MISIRIGSYQVEVKGSAKRVTVYYGSSPKPAILTVVGSDGEAWSISASGNELGRRPQGVTVHGGRSDGSTSPVKLA